MAKKISVWWIIIFILCFIASSVIVFFKSKKVESSERIKVVCSTFPVYDWTTHIVGDDSETIITSLLEKNGINFHSFVPTDSDVMQISSSNLFICNGSEDFLMDAAEKSDGTVLNLGNEIKNINSDLFEKDKDHIWLSVKNAKLFSKLIATEIIKLDPDNKDKYEKNLAKYIGQLDTLDEEFQEAFSKDDNKPLILCDNNPFLWLFSDYNIKFYSALPSCNTDKNLTGGLEKSVGQEIVEFLIEKMDENDSKYLFKLDNATNKFAYSVMKDSKNPLGDILTLETMHYATLSEVLKGKSFVKIMRANLEEMKKAL